MKRTSNRKEAYAAKLRDPRWQKVRLRIFERDGFKCGKCGDSKKELQIHHRWYSDGDPWGIEDGALITLCRDCHDSITALKRDIVEKLDINECFWVFWFAERLMTGQERSQKLQQIMHALYLEGSRLDEVASVITSVFDLANANYAAGLAFAENAKSQAEQTNESSAHSNAA